MRYVGPSDMDGHRGFADPFALRTTSRAIADAYARSTVREGDLVVSIGPAFGKTMMVTRELYGVNLTQDTARIACNPAKVVPAYLCASSALTSRFGTGTQRSQERPFEG